MRNYRDLGGARIWTEGEARWHPAEGAFSYGRFVLDSIAYNEAASARRARLAR